MMAIQVLYVCSGRSFHSQNPGRKIGSVVECWRDMGHDITHVCGGDILSEDSEPKEYGAQQVYTRWYRKLPIFDPIVKSVSERRDIQHDALMFKALNSMVEQQRPDIIWERSSRLHCAGLKIARKIGVPYVLEWKDNLIAYPCSWYRQRAIKMEQQKVDEADFIVVESDVLKHALAEEGVNQHKIITAHNAVDSDQFVPDEYRRMRTRKSLGIGDDEILIGYLGSYAFYHDTVRLVLAANILNSYPMKNVRILMVGAGQEYPKTRCLAEKLGVLNSVLMMKPGVPSGEVPGILSALDIAVLPGSTDIICPIKIQEYMASELPTVATDYACNREVITNGETGLLFEPKNENSLADKLFLLAKDSKLRKLLGRNARQEVVRRFTWKNTWGNALQEIIRSLKISPNYVGVSSNS
ncbi:MAG: glycosyltransferase family 4 protein [Desulfobacteraceae bacterium]|nr:glycosyltransferase family 4 protein [Desulfobacteraceae bacterium]